MLRGFADGYVAVLLPAYLRALGLGVRRDRRRSARATLAGSAVATIAVGALGHRFRASRLMLAAALPMVATGLGFAGLTRSGRCSWSPSSARSTRARATSACSCRWSTRGSPRRADSARPHGAVRALRARAAGSARRVGALASAWPAWLGAHAGGRRSTALRAMFVLYALIGVRRRAALPPACRAHRARRGARAPAPRSRSAPSRGIVVRLAALFSIDSFAGGLVVNSMLALWLFQRFGLSLARPARSSSGPGLLTTASQLRGAALARRIGLVNTMVFTHIPANLFLIARLVRADAAGRARRCCSCAARCRRWTCRRATPS